MLLAGEQPSTAGLAGSEYLRATLGIVAGKPQLDLNAAVALQRFLVAAAEAGVVRSAHDVAAGGLAVALAESCIAGGIGADIDAPIAGAALFAETQSCAVVSCGAEAMAEITALAARCGVAITRIGRVTGDALRFAGDAVPVAALRDAYEAGLPHALEGVTANV